MHKPLEFRGPRWFVRATIAIGSLATVASLLLLYMEAADHTNRWDADTLVWIDSVLCFIMIAEWFVLLSLSASKSTFVKARWIDLLAAAPLLLLFRPFRIIRLLRLLRVLRGIRMMRRAFRPWEDAMDTSLLRSVAVIAGVLVGGAALVIQDLERANPALDEFPEALWWAIVTASTVGYGDRYPLTGGGQVVAAILMIVGIGLFGALAAALTQTFLPKESGTTNKDLLERLTAIEKHLADLVQKKDGDD